MVTGFKQRAKYMIMKNISPINYVFFLLLFEKFDYQKVGANNLSSELELRIYQIHNCQNIPLKKLQ